MIHNDIISAYGGGYIAQLNFIESGDRLIHHDYLIDGSGDVRVRVNGNLLNELVSKKLQPHEL